MTRTPERCDDVYSQEVVRSRVGHLLWRKQQEIERICRILRLCFDPGDIMTVAPGRIVKIILIGPYARRTWYEDSNTMFFSDYELWVIVNLQPFVEEWHWKPARKTIERELGNRCAVGLTILSKSDIKSAKAGRDHFVLDRIEAGITLYKASRDAPLPSHGRRERGDD